MTLDEPITEPAPARTPVAPAAVDPTPPHRRWQDPTFVGVAVLVLAVAGFAIWWFLIRSTGGTTAAATTDQVVTATTGDMNRTVSATGTVAAAQSAGLSFSSAGTVTAVNVKAGDTVTTGEVLATIDPVQLQADVSSAQSTLASAEAKLSDDRSAGASSAQIAADEATVTSATDALTSARANLAGASLVATFDGTVASVNLTLGEQLGSGGTGATTATGTGTGSGQTSASVGSGSGNGNGFSNSNGNGSSSSSSSSNGQIQLVSSGRYTVSLGVGSSDISQVAVGQQATLTVSSATQSRGFGGGFARFFGGGNGTTTGRGTGGGTSGANGGSASSGTGATATGTVTDVGRVASASSGVASYPVTITFPASATQFFVGATVTGEIDVQSVKHVIQVPSRAVTTGTDGQATVVVATDGTASGPRETRDVTTGLVSGGETQIVSGLRAGEHVVISLPTFPGATGRTGTGGNGFAGFGGGGTGGFGGGGNGVPAGGGPTP